MNLPPIQFLRVMSLNYHYLCCSVFESDDPELPLRRFEPLCGKEGNYNRDSPGSDFTVCRSYRP